MTNTQKILTKLLSDTGMLESENRCKIVADELIANGVIVLPCKVGDKVFTAVGEIVEDKVISCEVYVKVEKLIKGKNIRFAYNVEDFGSIIFLTKEEAIEAWNRRADNGKL